MQSVKCEPVLKVLEANHSSTLYLLIYNEVISQGLFR